MSKKPFYYKGLPVKACGLILINYQAEEPYYLLQKKGNVYEDFGGRIDHKLDTDIFDTMTREAYEESNGIFDRKSLKERLLNSPYFYYNSHSNYLLAILPSTFDETLLTSNDFGIKEVNDKQIIKRSVVWVPVSCFKKKQIHPRLNCQQLIVN